MDFLLDSPVAIIIIAAVAVYILLTSTLTIRRIRRGAAGTSAEVACKACSQLNPGRASFCRRCGKKLA